MATGFKWKYPSLLDLILRGVGAKEWVSPDAETEYLGLDKKGHPRFRTTFYLKPEDPTYTFQPSTIDTYLHQGSPDSNFGTDTVLEVLSYTTSNVRSILKFDMTSQIPAGSTINSATLSLYYETYVLNLPTGRTYWVYRLTQTAWTETGSTWNKYDGTNAWTTAGGDYTTTNGASTTVPSSYTWMSWTVTAQVQYAVTNVGRIAHFLVKDGTEDNAAGYGAYFWAKEYTGTLTPKLYVDWTLIVTRALTQGLQIRDSKVKLTGFVRSKLEPLRTSEACARVGIYYRTRLDSLQVRESLVRLMAFQRSLTQPMRIVDVVAVRMSYLRLFTESMTIRDTTARLGAYYRTSLDSHQLGEVVARIGAYSRLLTQPIQTRESIARVGAYSRSLTQAITFRDATSTILAPLPEIIFIPELGMWVLVRDKQFGFIIS